MVDYGGLPSHKFGFNSRLVRMALKFKGDTDLQSQGLLKRFYNKITSIVSNLNPPRLLFYYGGWQYNKSMFYSFLIVAFICLGVLSRCNQIGSDVSNLLYQRDALLTKYVDLKTEQTSFLFNAIHVLQVKNEKISQRIISEYGLPSIVTAMANDVYSIKLQTDVAVFHKLALKIKVRTSESNHEADSLENDPLDLKEAYHNLEKLAIEYPLLMEDTLMGQCSLKDHSPLSFYQMLVKKDQNLAKLWVKYYLLIGAENVETLVSHIICQMCLTNESFPTMKQMHALFYNCPWDPIGIPGLKPHLYEEYQSELFNRLELAQKLKALGLDARIKAMNDQKKFKINPLLTLRNHYIKIFGITQGTLDDLKSAWGDYYQYITNRDPQQFQKIDNKIQEIQKNYESKVYDLKFLLGNELRTLLNSINYKEKLEIIEKFKCVSEEINLHESTKTPVTSNIREAIQIREKQRHEDRGNMNI